MNPAYIELFPYSLTGRIKQILRHLDVPVYIKGYPYLKSTVLHALGNPGANYLITKDVCHFHCKGILIDGLKRGECYSLRDRICLGARGRVEYHE